MMAITKLSNAMSKQKENIHLLFYRKTKVTIEETKFMNIRGRDFKWDYYKMVKTLRKVLGSLATFLQNNKEILKFRFI